MKYYLVAGEASGDLHGANLIKALKEKDAHASFRGWGGEKMEARGMELVKHYRDHAYMGFVDVLKNLPTILKNIRNCKEDIESWLPDAVILIDYPGFNLRVAPFVKKLGIKVIWYISPQVWAWKASRVKKIKKFVDHMLVILPFEKDFYRKKDYAVDFVGHPLLDAIESRVSNQGFREANRLDNRPIITLLPGSRKQEIKVMLPQFTTLLEEFPGYQFVVGSLGHLGPEFYSKLLKGADVRLVVDQTYDLLENAHAALVTSGTATLETALFNVPEVVCYRGHTISYYFVRRLVKVKYISLVNLIMGREVVKELIQFDMKPENLKKELELLLDADKRATMFADYLELKQKLGDIGASQRAATLIWQYLN